MGVFDFVKDIGAKVGLGGGDEEAEPDTAADDAAKKAKAAAMERGLKVQEKMAEQAADAEKAAKAAASREAAKKKLEERKAKAKYAAYKKSIELEKYVRDLGIDMSGVDIRFQGDTAYIEGEAVDQATKEKIILTVGNAKGVARVDEEITVAAAEPAAEFHTVAAGDTLWAVAEKVYGDGNRYTEIFEANKPMLSDPDLIFPGQVLRCPK